MPMKEVAGRDYPDIQKACFDLLESYARKLVTLDQAAV